MGSIELGEIIESFNAVKTEKMPFAKTNIMKFMEQAVRITYIDALEEVVESLAPLAVKTSDEKDGVLRD